MKMMPYGVAAALLLGGSLLAPSAQAWQSGTQSQSSSVQPSDSQSQSQLSIRDLQQELQQAGLYSGTIDGVWGPKSRSAMAQYQKQRGLNPSGQLDHDTLQAMRGDNGATQSGGSGLDEILARRRHRRLGHDGPVARYRHRHGQQHAQRSERREQRQ